MIIPIKCFTCGKVLANKYRWYQIEVRKKKVVNDILIAKIVYLTKENTEKTIEGEIMDKLKLNKYCCRRHMLTHVDIN